ncbi:MAG: flagellar filament capping protein FliD [Solirubrobacteraceae bacterium]|nr:flagellar filament capping protein FliD [Solirubrobacteraceae bacterium]
MAGIALNGLSSGLDTGTMISQLMQLERVGRTKLEYRQANTQARTDNLADVTSKLNTLKFRAQDFKLSSLWTPQQTVDVSDATKISATRTGGAGTGSTSIEVLGLASSSQRTFTYTSPAADETWTFGSANVNITAGMTLDETVLAINGQPDTGVIAVNAGGKLVVSSTATGAASTFGWTAAALSQDSEKLGTDAQYRVDGGALQTSSKNTISTAVPGVDITLKALTTSPVSVTVSSPTADKTKVIEKLKSFVEAYNTVVDTVKNLTGERKITDPASAADARKGSLYADNGLRSLQSSMRNAISSAMDGLTNGDLDQLAEIGITTGAASSTINQDSLAGKLVFDEAKFSAAFAANPTDVRKLLGGVSGTNGLAQRFEALIDPITQTGGVLSNRRTETDSELRRIKDSIERFDDRLVFKEQRLRKQFEVMETMLARQNSIGSALSSALAGLPSSS